MESVFAGAAAYHLYVSLMCCYLYSPERKEGKKKKKKKKLYVPFTFLSNEFLPSTVTVAGCEQSSELLSASYLT
jgi:hypothetical protein